MMIYMANISKRLKSLFWETINRVEEEKKNPPSRLQNPSNPYYGNSNSLPRQRRLNFSDDDDFYGVIYFYEWSDIARAPKSYYTLRAFENFLISSNIYIAGYQRELIKNIQNPYVACKKGSNELIIKGNFMDLKTALAESKSPSEEENGHKGSEDVPYGVSITYPPQAQKDNAVKVLSCGVYPPNLPKSLIQKPPMKLELENRWSDCEEMHPEIGGCWGW